jgi:sec-independent protein translocase protein TatB
MLEVGWSEILVVALILIIVVGPKDLPGMLRNFGRMAARVRGMANEFKGQFDQALREAELDDVRKGLNEVSKLNPTNTLRDAINPIRQLGQDIKSDLQKTSNEIKAAAEAPATKDEVPAVQPVAEAAPADVKPTETKPVEATPVDTGPVAAASVAPGAGDKPAAKPKAPRKPVAKPIAEPAAVAQVETPKKPAARRKPAAAAPEAAAAPAARKAAPRKKPTKTGDA